MRIRRADQKLNHKQTIAEIKIRRISKRELKERKKNTQIQEFKEKERDVKLDVKIRLL
jgi:hypothetical protein